MAKIKISFALLVVRLPLFEVVVSPPLAWFTEPSATAEVVMPENSSTMIPGLFTPPEVV